MYQQIIVIGRVGKDPEIRSLKSGVSVANFSVASSETWKDKSGEKKERTEWFNVVAFERTAEIANQFLRKGNLVTVIGRIKTETYEDKKGETRYATKLYVDRLVLMPNKDAGRSEEPRGDLADSASDDAPDEDFEDDIPF